MSIIYGKINKWPEGTVEIVKRTLGMLHFDVYICTSTSGIRHSKTDSFCKVHIGIMYQPIYKVFIAWNVGVKVALTKGRTVVDDFKSLDAFKYKKNEDRVPIAVSYKSRNSANDYPKCTEKILIIEENALYEFCNDYAHYLYPNEKDPKDTAFVPPFTTEILIGKEAEEPIEREIIKVNRKKRDPNFRNKVINEKSRCIVCGSRESRILEAAHIIAVADGGSDEAENGICLCVNHHRLFDSGLLRIDFQNRVFECNGTSEINMPWYKEAQRRKMKLYD